ncbi:7-cyano-7-deazaguanine synthase [Marinobacter sp. X15-166B]|uniref:7-cyano-7-deazaguanine synthase n=1 Tax=Marinobacter sp. X15-166B TaxID=1897620 RepID=UPI0009424D50|nr:7-cyano-7-deazaguanine synthase [Marinobacter sp. X15-166B]
MSTKQPTINVLWTGGYDSTFRIVQLSKLNVTIQPFYLSDNRKSEPNELRAIADITRDIKTSPGTKCTLKPLKTYISSEVKVDDEITQAYHRLQNTAPLGSQYDWLARFAKEKNIEGLELGIEKSDTSVVLACIRQLGHMTLVNDGAISYYILSEEKSDPDLYKVLGNFHYPNPLFNMTKTEMLTEYKRLGFEKTVYKTWFCHRPIKGKPCGICNPCKSVISADMRFRLPKLSLIRYKFRPVYTSKSKMEHFVKRCWDKLINI